MGQHRLVFVSLRNRIDWEVYVMARKTLQGRRLQLLHIHALMDEIDYLDTIIKPQDCGHLITCRDVLEAHLDQLIKEREINNEK
tara:strand:- start:205 stop:456 length:252 start_codon:yes stop_codon:yes gene_type:complete